ncbi:MAG: hypothetical protein SPL30_04820 [Succinivibrio sp.]|nr:hypothetical protein [Succinivibrio sp.]
MTQLDTLEAINRDVMQRLDDQFIAVVSYSGYVSQDTAARMRYLVNAAKAAQTELFGYIVKLQEKRMCDEDDA